MKTQISPAVVGAFVLGAFTLALLALLYFGGVSFFHQQPRFLVYFDEPIQGLNLGSPVKFLGVGVGRVVGLNIRYDERKNQPLVAVLCEFDKNMIRDDRGQPVDISRPRELNLLVQRGLRAQLGILGLATSLLYVELEFFEPPGSPVENPAPEAKYPIIPTIRSTNAEVMAAATEILGKLRRVDFEGLSNDLKNVLVDTRRQINNLDLKGLSGQWRETGAAVAELVKSPEIRQTISGLNTTLADVRSAVADLRRTLGTVNSTVDADGKELRVSLARVQGTLQQFEAAAVTLRRFIDSQQNLGDDAHDALTHLAAAADAVQRLADYLERNPNALISGRAR